jgi:DNA replication protein DnaC
VPTLLDQLRDAVRTGTFHEIMSALIEIPVLALDEFHRAYERTQGADLSEGSPSWAAEKLFQIIDTRYLHWETRLTLIATNREPDQGGFDPIDSRFSDTLRVHVVHMNGRDLRPHARRLESDT